MTSMEKERKEMIKNEKKRETISKIFEKIKGRKIKRILIIRFKRGINKYENLCVEEAKKGDVLSWFKCYNKQLDYERYLRVLH